MIVFQLKLEKETAVVRTLVKKLTVFCDNFATNDSEESSIPTSYDSIDNSTNNIPADDSVNNSICNAPEEPKLSFEKSRDIIYVLAPKKAFFPSQKETKTKLIAKCKTWQGDLYYFEPTELQSFCGFFGQLMPYVGEKEKSKSPAKKIPK